MATFVFSDLSNQPDEEGYYREAVAITPEAIAEEFTRIPSDLAFWGERFAESSRTYLLAEQAVKECRSRLRLAIRETAAVKMTVDAVEAEVEGRAEYQSLKLAEIESEAAKMMSKARLDALIAKKDMLVSLGAHIRAEMGPAHIRDRGDRY